MIGNVTPEKAISFVRFYVAIMCCCPLPKSTSKTKSCLYHILRFIMTLNALFVILPQLYTFYVIRNNPTRIILSGCITLIQVQVILFPIVCTLRYNRLQLLMEEMKVYCENANELQRSILQRYLGTYALFYCITTLWFYMTATSFIVGALFSSQKAPTYVEYPFFIDFEPVRSIIYAQQSILSIQCSGRACMSVLNALLLLFSAARLETIKYEFIAASSYASLIECWKKYYMGRSYAIEMVSTIRCLILIPVLLRSMILVLSGIVLIGDASNTLRVQSLLVILTGLMEVLTCTLPADRLMKVSEDVIDGIYECKWYEQSLVMQKTVTGMLMPLDPVAIRLQYFIPCLTLNYFCSFLSNVFSLFTTLRVMVHGET